MRIRSAVLVVAAVAALCVSAALPAHASVLPDTAQLHGCRNPAAAPSSVVRYAGADRFEVSAMISAKTYSANTPVAYVVSGRQFPDALSASAASGGLSGPVLLVDGADRAPDVIEDELRRLQPQMIFVLGGTEAVSAALESTLERFSPVVRRIAGADRFEVSAEVARQLYLDGVPKVYVASGVTFPDALSAAAVAGDLHAPVLLVTRDGIPAPVAQILAGLPTLTDIVVVGGTQAISDSVGARLGEFGTVSRIAGPDRFAVSAAISATHFCGDDRATVFVASGEDFPDALSASAAAVAVGGPVLLVRHDAIPEEIARELRRLSPQSIILLGGEEAIAHSVEAQLGAFLRK